MSIEHWKNEWIKPVGAARSIVTRLLVFAVIMILGGSAIRSWAFSGFLRDDLIAVNSAQLDALSHDMANEVDYRIGLRRRLLTHLVEKFPCDLLSDPQAMSAWLADHHQTNPLFSRIVILAPDGNLVGDSANFEPRNYADRAYFQAALAGALTIGPAVVGRSQGLPVLPIAAPIRDHSGRVAAVIAGITRLDAPEFLQPVNDSHIGNTGGFLLISPTDQIFIAASRPELVLKPTAAPGINNLHDRASAGWRGTGITINAQGVEEIVAVTSVQSTGWFMVARLPTNEALALVADSRHGLIVGTIIVTLVATILVLIYLNYVLRPLKEAAQRAALMTTGEIPLQPLPIRRNDEVGYLTAAFNALLEKLSISQADMARLARHDALTGLPNRVALSERVDDVIARVNRHGGQVTALFLDLDGFKLINDNLGHEAGDVVLAEAAKRLQGVVREVDFVARVGGDEFVILVDARDDDVAARGAAAVIADKCIAAIGLDFEIGGQLHRLGVSIGIALGGPDTQQDLLLSSADDAMYAAKRAGKNRWVLAE